MLRDYKGAEELGEATDPNAEAAIQFARASFKRVGRVLAGRYELLRTIGIGGMGAVFEARHQITGRRVAVKLIHSNLAGNKTHVSRFMREAKAASEIGHPAIVDVLDAGTTEDGLVYMVLELLEGEDLEDSVRHGRLSTAGMVDVAAQVLECLAAAHEHGIVHRDIKPENVFLIRTEGAAPRVKVLDFGIAKHLRDDPDTAMTRTGTIVGTPDFMSPEQARGDDVDGRTDVWAVGALLYYALTGEPPFTAENYNKLIIRIVTEDAPSLGRRRPDLPSVLIGVVDRAMRTQRDDRWPDARAMAQALRAIRVPDDDPAVPRLAPRVRIGESGVRETDGSGATQLSPAPATPAAASAREASAATRRSPLLALLVAGLAFVAGATFLLVRLLGGDAGPAPAPVPPGWTGAQTTAPDTRTVARPATSEVPAPPTPAVSPPPATAPAPAPAPTPVGAPARPIAIRPRDGHAAPDAGPTKGVPPVKTPRTKHPFATIYE